MKLVVIYGEGLSAQLLKITSIKKSFDSLSIVHFNGLEVNFEKIIVDISTTQLFSDKRLVILEDFDQTIDLEKLPSDSNLTVLVYFAKPLPVQSNVLKEAKRLKAEIFNYPADKELSVFPFLDLLAEKNPKAFELLYKLLSQFGGQYVLTMIFYMLRRLILPTAKLPNFVIQKIEKQKRIFSRSKVNEIYRYCLEQDYKIKNGFQDEKIALTLIAEKILSI